MTAIIIIAAMVLVAFVAVSSCVFLGGKSRGEGEE